MLDLIINFSLKNRFLVLFSTAIIFCSGVWALFHTPVDAFPDTTPIQVQINTIAPALNPEEIEQQITLPVELSIGGLPGLENVRSISKFGLCQVVATFNDSTSIVDARQYISERLASIELPEGIGRPQLGPIATGLGEIFHYTLNSNNPNRTLEELRTIQDWVIKPELRKISGVAEINSWGGYERQYHVIISPASMVEYDLSLEEVFNALENNNGNVGGGTITVAGQSKLVHGIGRVYTIDQIKDIVIKSNDGVPLRIRDISEEVKIGYEIRRGAVTAQGQGEVVLGLAFMLMGENAKSVTERLKSKLEIIKKALPKDVIVTIVYDRTELTTEVINTVKHSLYAGAVLVIVVLFLLLGNLRAGLLVAITIPISMLFAILGMHQFSIAASLLSLGAIDFGIIVDGSVVMTEANLRNLDERYRELGRPLTTTERLETLLKSCKEVVRPVVFGMGIIAIVFIPILTLEGTEGKMFRPMAWTFIFALSGALLISLILSPVLGFYFLPSKAKVKHSFFIQFLINLYSSALTLSVKLRWLVLTIVFVSFCVTGWLTTRIGSEFIPKLGEGSIVINTIRLAGISIEESVRYNSRIEKMLLDEYPSEIRTIWSRLGTAEVATDPMGTELTDIFISLKPREQWKKATTQKELVSAMQKSIADLPGLNMVFTQPIEMRLNEMESGIRSDIGIKIYGDDFDELIRISDDVQKVLVQIKGATDIATDQITGQPTLRVTIDQKMIAQYGLNSREILDAIETVGGKKVGEIFEGQKKFSLVVRLPDSHRIDSDVLANTIIPTKTGEKIPLKMLAKFTNTEGAATINREWGRRLIRVQCNVAGRDVASFVDEAKQKIYATAKLPEGYMIDWGGQFENLEKAKLRLAIVLPVTLLLIFFLLYFSLKNIRDVLLIYTGIPFALIGGIFALWLRGLPFSMSAAVGFIALCGIAVLNGQILVSAFRTFMANGHTLHEAVLKASHQRLIPVLATAIVDAVGFIPMAISSGVGAEVQRPLATVVIGGVLTSTLLTLLVLPIIFSIFGRATEKESA